MDDGQYKDMVIAHDKHIDTLATSIEHLAHSVGSTNGKLDDVIDVITQQNVLVERMNNLDANVSESFKRAWGRLEKLESSESCNLAKELVKERELTNEKLKVSNNRITDSEDDIKGLNEKVGDTLATSTIKWAMGLLIFYSVAFGTYVVNHLHETDTAVASYIARDSEVSKTHTKRLDDIISIMRDKDGSIVTRSMGSTYSGSTEF